MRIYEARSVLDPDDTYLFKEVSSEPLVAGTETPKSVVKVHAGNSALTLSYIQRPHYQHYINTWQYFRRHHMPVAPGLFEVVHGNNQCLLVSDVKADGAEIYGKSLETQLREGSIRSRPPKAKIDRMFLDLVKPSSFHRVEERAEFFVHRASNVGITLPPDDPFELDVNYKGWDLITLDLGEGGKDLNVMPVNELVKLNSEAVDVFLDDLVKIRDMMS